MREGVRGASQPSGADRGGEFSPGAGDPRGRRLLPPLRARPGGQAAARCVVRPRGADLAVHRRAGCLARAGAHLQDRQRAAGQAEADIVYLIPVEGGLSRIMAVFSSRYPPVVGPVRSARADDLELLRQFGRPAFAFSGAQPKLLPVVEHARIVNLYAGVTRGYFRSAARIAPYNLYARTRELLAQAGGASRARGIGFRFGPAPPGGTPTASFSAGYPAASFTFRWSAASGRWLVWMDGAPARDAADGRLGGPTVVVQYVKVVTSRFKERGVRPPYAQTVGAGRALVLRDGRAYQARWSRPAADGGTAFTLPDGHPMPFARGQVWVLLAIGPGSTSN